MSSNDISYLAPQPHPDSSPGLQKEVPRGCKWKPLGVAK